MRNETRQKKLDEMKWHESQKAGADQSGMMDYCEYCEMSESMDCYCSATQEEREKKFFCAKAYNRMKRKKS